jgi:hypothetical protein
MQRIIAIGVLVAVLWPTGSRAESALRHGTTSYAQPGVNRTWSAMPAVPGAWHFATQGQIGWQPDVLQQDDLLQRIWARMAVGYSPWSFLQVSLATDIAVAPYRLPDSTDEEQAVVGAFGDFRLNLRTGWALGSVVNLGVLASILFPSGIAGPEGSSISTAATVLMSIAPSNIPLGVHVNIGYRNDRSQYVVGNLSSVQRELILLADINTVDHFVTAGLGVEYRLGPVAPFAEFHADLALDGEAMEYSPLRVGVGLRVWLGPYDVVQLTAGGEFRVSKLPPDPDPASETAYSTVPVASVGVGIAFRMPVREAHDDGGDGASGDDPDGDPRTGPDGEPVVTAGATGRMSGAISCAGSPCGRGTVVRFAGSDASPLLPDEETGRFTTVPLPVGTYQLEGSSPGHEAQTAEVVVEGDGEASVSLDLPVAEGAERPGVRGQVTNFNNQPVAATVRIPALGLEVQCDDDGRFETEVEPGRYEVIVSAPGYRTQRTHVEVWEAGVVIMNIELRNRRGRRR